MWPKRRKPVGVINPGTGGADPPPDSGWIPLVMENAWVSESAPATAVYRKQGNIVRLRGAVNSGASGTVIATLPAGFLPACIEQYLLPISGGADAVLEIDPGGDLTPIFASGNTIFLDVVTFTVD